MVGRSISGTFQLQVPDLTNDDKVQDIIIQILNIDKDQSKNFIGNTTKTAYRRLHERLASIIDSAMENIEKLSVSSNRYIMDLVKVKILIKYQMGRKQISHALGNYLLSLVDELISIIKRTSQNAESAKQGAWDKVATKRALDNARTIIDAVAVVVYQYAE
ncbi:hypothetical protein [Pyrobaculum islandicum]|nr:hypothetical protein [Pyrobaculum islandicum]